MPLKIVRDDLVNMQADAVVLPSNERLVIDGGAGGAVARKAGLVRLRMALRRIGGCPTGSAVSTKAYSFPAKYLIHAVGPVWGTSADDTHLLQTAYDAALGIAADLKCQSVALPLLSAGSFGCPAHVSLSIALAAIERFLDAHDLDVTLVLFDKKAVAASLDFLVDLESRIDDAYADEMRYATNMSYAAETYVPMPEEAESYPVYWGDASDLRMQMPPEPSYPPPGAGAPSYAPASAPREVAKRELEPVYAPEPADVDEDDLRADLAPGDTGELRLEMHELSAGFAASAAASVSLEDRLDNIENSFSQALLALIDESGMTDAEVYRRANMSRQHFSKIRSNAGYRPGKATVLSLCIALELNLAQTRDLLERAGFALSHASKFDIIVEYFIEQGIYDPFKINETLFYFDQQLLGG